MCASASSQLIFSFLAVGAFYAVQLCQKSQKETSRRESKSIFHGQSWTTKLLLCVFGECEIGVIAEAAGVMKAIKKQPR
jgi:hypothetical protein